jgi:NAD-dependent SIR2 family protein deacetylase
MASGPTKRRDFPQKLAPFNSIAPSEGHMAVAELQNLGKLRFFISQNVDNLHLRSGIRPAMLAELHGNVTKLRCASCEAEFGKSAALAEFPSCGGKLASSVVDFGQPLPRKALHSSYEHSEKCDLFLVVGSSLVVTPAAEMPRLALQSGARLVIINEGETPLDQLAHLRFREKIGKVLPPAVARLKKRIMAAQEQTDANLSYLIACSLPSIWQQTQAPRFCAAE